MTSAARKAVEITALGVVPLLSLALGLATFAGQDRLALDFHQELYPQAQAVVHGRDAYPPPDADLSDGTNAIWPLAAVLPVVPLTALNVRYEATPPEQLPAVASSLHATFEPPQVVPTCTTESYAAPQRSTVMVPSVSSASLRRMTVAPTGMSPMSAWASS